MFSVVVLDNGDGTRRKLSLAQDHAFLRYVKLRVFHELDFFRKFALIHAIDKVLTAWD